ncbi:hypothetical protein Tco_1420891 [Tanacetum coccineum]
MSYRSRCLVVNYDHLQIVRLFSTLERVTIGCFKVGGGGGGGGGVTGGVGVVCGDGVDSEVGGIVSGLVCGFVVCGGVC